jgi:hypothetical protein
MSIHNKNDEKIFKHFMAAYKHQWDLNQYCRTQYDEDLEHYRSYKSPSETPLAYNVSFNKLLPRMYTMLSRFMDQLYQAGSADLISVRPRKRGDVERAPRVQGLLNYQLETLNNIDMQGGSYLFNFSWMFNALTFGKGIAKMYWRREERITPRRIDVPIPKFGPGGRLVGLDHKPMLVEAPQMVYDGPYAEVLHNKMFVPHPHYKNIQKMPAVFCVYKRSLDYIHRMADKGAFNKKYLKHLGRPSDNPKQSSMAGRDTIEAIIKSLEIDKAMTDKELDSDRITPEIDIIEGHGRVILPKDETPIEVGKGYKLKGRESEVVVHIANYRVLLSMQENKSEIRPFFDISCYWNPELYWDIGVINLGKAIQEQYNNLGNLRLQNAMMLVNHMLKVKEDSEIDPKYLVWKPFGLIPVEEMDDVQPLITPDISQSRVFKEQESFFEETLSDMIGVYPYNMGQTPPRQERVGTIYSLQSMGEARTRLLMMTMDHQGFRPLLHYMMYLNMLHLDPKVEARINSNRGVSFSPLFSGDLHVDYDFSARYTAMEPALGKHFRAQQLIQYAQMWQDSPYLQQHQFMKAIMELLDFHDSETYLKTPQQVAQEQRQQQEQAARMQLMGAAIQDQAAGQASKRSMQEEVIKGLMR